MPFILDALYLILIFLISPVLLYKILKQGKYLDSLPARLGVVGPVAGNRPRIWLHGVSVGEIKTALPLVRTFSQYLPQWEVVLSTTTSTGQQVAHQLYPKHRIIYFPFDLSGAVEKYLRLVRPQLVILMELELWPNFLLATQRHQIPVMVVNGRITARSFRNYKRYLGWAFVRMTAGIRYFAVQSPEYATRFQALGIAPERIQVTGSMKFDAIDQDALEQARAKLQAQLTIPEHFRVLLGGSTHSPEEQYLIASYLKLRVDWPHLRLILVPRHPHRVAEVAQWLKQHGLSAVLKSKLNQGAHLHPWNSDKVLLVDTMGELGALYTIADLVVMGGSLIDHGGQNLLEPAAAGCAIVLGPSMYNFPYTPEFLESGAACQINTPAELTTKLQALLRDPHQMQTMGKQAQALIKAKQGATLRNFELCQSILHKGAEL